MFVFPSVHLKYAFALYTFSCLHLYVESYLVLKVLSLYIGLGVLVLILSQLQLFRTYLKHPFGLIIPFPFHFIDKLIIFRQF